MATNAQVFSEASHRLRNSSPQEFEQFVELFAAYTEEVVFAVTEADPTNILVMQGRAQQCRALLRILRECDKTKPTTPTPLSP